MNQKNQNDSKRKTITFQVVDWLPCDEKIAENRTPVFGKTGITKNKDGLIDSVLTVAGHIVIACCSEDYILPEPFDEFIFEKKNENMINNFK